MILLSRERRLLPSTLFNELQRFGRLNSILKHEQKFFHISRAKYIHGTYK